MSKEWMHDAPAIQVARYDETGQHQDTLEQVTLRPCEITHCSHTAYWSFNQIALCDTCILSMACMNSDNVEAFLPALAYAVIADRAKADYWLCADAIGYLQIAIDRKDHLYDIARCNACQSVLCGVCGLCHSFDLDTGEKCARDEYGITNYHCESWALAHTAINEVKAKYHL